MFVAPDEEGVRVPDPAASLEARYSEGPPRRLEAAARLVGRPSRLAAEVEFALGLAAPGRGERERSRSNCGCWCRVGEVGSVDVWRE